MKYATLTQKGKPENTFNLDGNTVIGRSAMTPDEVLFALWRERLKGRNHCNEGFRKGGITFEDLRRFYGKRTLDIVITDTANYLSRRHLIFCLPEGELDGYYLVDLFSCNGTRVNGEYIEPGIPRIVNHGDIINLPNSKDARTDFKFRELERVTQYDGLIVANPDGTLPNHNEQAQALKRLLAARGFNIELLMSSINSEQVVRALEERKKRLTESSYFLFMYLGHGSENGDLLLKDRSLNVREIYKHLGQIRAKKLILIGCCYSSNYLVGVPQHSAVAVCNRNPTVNHSGVFADGLINALRSQDAGMYFEELIEKACRSVEYDLRRYGMDPGREIRSEVYVASRSKRC